MNTVDIPILRLAVLYLALVPFFLLLSRLGIPLGREAAASIARMSVQLALVGVYLKYLFILNNPWLNLLWAGVIVVAAVFTALAKAGLSRRIFWPILAGTSTATAGVGLFFLLFLIRPEPLYDARYLVVLTGMLLGNCLQGNVIALERFYAAIRNREEEYLSYLLMGATVREAAQPFEREAVRAALAPTIATMATMGIVSLPGMMTGQILGGASPLLAIKYQVMIMLGIFLHLSFSLIMNLRWSLPLAVDRYGLLKEELFVPPGK